MKPMYPIHSYARRARNRVRTALIVLSGVVIAVACSDGVTDPIDSTDPISVATTSLAEAIEGQSYNQQLEAVGGSGGYSWILAAGSLPAGLTISPVGTISGTPVAPGTSSFRVRVTDSGGRSATADLTIPAVQTLAVHTWTLPEGVVGEDYAAQLQAVGGRGTHTWTLAGDGAGSWLTVSPAGVISGTPATAGVSTVTVTVADESGQQATRPLSIAVLAPVTVADVSLPTATQGRGYAAQLVVIGGNGAYTWDIQSGPLPAGLTLSSAGALTGTTEDAGVFTFTARVTDSGGRAGTRALSLTVERAPTIQTTILPSGRPAEPYTVQLVASGGTGAYSWSVTDGALPGGLTLSAAGAISGTPTALGGATFTVRVSDQAAASHSRAFTLVIAQAGELVSGQPLTGLNGDPGSVRYYGIEVPAGATQLIVGISGGTGDVDLYVRRGALPMEYVYDCRPFRPGNDETCTFSSPFLTAGPWYIMLRGYAAYADVTLVATHDG
jgi:large repetitive protein